MIIDGLEYVEIVLKKKLVVKIRRDGRSYMPMPNHCIECDKVAVVLDNAVPYCTQCYKKEIMNVKRKSNKKITRSMRKSTRGLW